MIINSINSDKIKLILDENDLKKSDISLKEWISNPQKTSIFLNKLLEKNIIYNSNNKVFKEFHIFTYNFKIFCIEIFF